jgi:hypothetical protein
VGRGKAVVLLFEAEGEGRHNREGDKPVDVPTARARMAAV